MGRLSNLAARLGAAGAVALLAGTTMIVGVAVQSLTSPAFADSAPFELFCTNSPIGDLVFNDIVVTASLSPPAPAPGQQFNVVNFQAQVPIPQGVAQQAAIVGNNSLSGSVSVALGATGATPATTPSQSLPYNTAIPNPVPPSGFMLDVPSTPSTIGPFTATSGNIAISLGSVVTLSFNDAAFSFPLPPINCAPYANNVLPSGQAQGIPPGLPITPVIATAGQVTPPPTNPITGAYELYCPHTPVGDLVFNDVTTSATVSPSALSAGDTFQVTGYQTTIPLPAGLAAAAVGLGNTAFNGIASSSVDAYGATPAQGGSGSIAFNVPIPTPVPSAGLQLQLPPSPMTLGPFTANGGPVTIAQDQSLLVVAELSSKAFKMSCTSYPNDSVAHSGSVSTAPTVNAIRPVIAVASASGTPTTTTTTPGGGPFPIGPSTVAPGKPFELFCPGTPIGSLAINDTTISASLSPTTLVQGDQFQLSNLQMAFSLPQNVVQTAEGLGLTQLSGDISLFLSAPGTEGGGYGGYALSTVSSSGGTVVVGSTTATTAPSGPGSSVIIPGPYPYPYPFPGLYDLSFDVNLPSPVPSTGVQFTATSQATVPPFTASGGPITIAANGFNLNVSAFGDHFGLFCNSYANDAVPTGLATSQPFNQFVEPIIATGTASFPPPPPPGPGGSTPYELYCPGTPVGSIVLNNVSSTGSLSPANPAAGDQFNLTDYQSQVPLPANIVNAASALGNVSIMGSATATIDALGATPASVSSGTMSFNVPIPTPVPPSGLTLTVPSPGATVGPFTASGGTITLSESPQIQLSIMVSGSALNLSCTAYPDNSAPSGIATTIPTGSPISPVVVTTSPPTGGSSDVTAITQAYQSFLDSSTPAAQRIALVQNGSTIQDALTQAGQSPLVQELGGAHVSDVILLDTATCAQDGLPSPCAQVAFDILSTSGGALLPGQQGFAVQVNGTWLVAMTTVCGLLQNVIPGTPPGCPASGSPPTTIAPVGGTSPGSSGGPPTTSTPVSPVTSTTSPPDTTLTSAAPSTTDTTGTSVPETQGSSDPASTTTGSPASDGASTVTNASSASGASSNASSGSQAPAGARNASVVTATSGSLAFTGPGPVTWWLLVVGGALVVLGLAALVLADAPRRLFAAVGRPGVSRGSDEGSFPHRQHERLWHEVLWVPRFGTRGAPGRE